MLDEAYQEAQRRILESSAICAPTLDLCSDVPGRPRLEQLDRIPSEVGELCEQLIEIRIGRTNVSSLDPLQGLKELRRLSVESTRVTDISIVAEFTCLESLNISHNRICDLAPISNLLRLRQIKLDDTDVEYTAPLKELKSLFWLSLDRTRIRDLATIDQLERLNCISFNGTQIESVELLVGLRQLTSIKMIGSSVKNLAPLAEMTWISAAAQRKSALSNSISGVFYRSTPIARDHPFDKFARLGQPASTVETIHYLRKLRCLPLRIPTGHKKPKHFERPKI